MGSGAIALIPLIAAGFLFNLFWYRMRFLLSGAEGQRLFFASAASGIVLAAIAFPAYKLLSVQSPDAIDFFEEYYPIPIAGELLLTLVLAVLLGAIFNLVEIVLMAFSFGKTYRASWAIFDWHFLQEQIHQKLMRYYANPFKQLLVDAFQREALVLLSLSSRKVYCGVIYKVTSLMRDEDQYVEIVPMFSAHRDKDSLDLKGRLDYQVFSIWRIQRRVAALESIVAEVPRTNDETIRFEVAHSELEELREVLKELTSRAPEYIDSLPINDWVKIIPLSEVETASIYDEAAYDAWFKDSPQPGHSPSSTETDWQTV